MTIRYNEDLDPNEGPGFGCFIWQAILFAGILLLIPVGVFTFKWPVWLLATLMFIDLFLLFFVSMTARLPAAGLLRRSAWAGAGGETGVAKQPPRVISTADAAADEPAEPGTPDE